MNSRSFALIFIILLVGTRFGEMSIARRAVGFPSTLRKQEASPELQILACNPEKPTVWTNESIRVRAWASSTKGQSLEYMWTTTAGQIAGQGPEARWDFTEVQPGLYTATVRVSYPTVGSLECSIRVRARIRLRDELPRFPVRSFLAREETEADGFGLYSYLLLSSPPNEATRERYLKAIQACLRLIPDIASFQEKVPPAEQSVTYIPVDDDPKQPVSPEWVLDHYDYARARLILRIVPGNQHEGPYFISALTPLSQSPIFSGPLLYQNLSWVPPDLVSLWVIEFLNQAAQERFWEERTGQQFVLKLRTTIGMVGLGWKLVNPAWKDWIAWTRGSATS